MHSVPLHQFFGESPSIAITAASVLDLPRFAHLMAKIFPFLFCRIDQFQSDNMETF